MAPPVYSFGVDLSKRFLDCFLLPEQSRFRLTHDEAGITQLRDRARDLLRTGARVLVVVEASGGYERLLHERLAAAEVPIAIVNPKRVRAYAKGIGRLAKTDRVDAQVLARYGLTEQPRPTPLPDPARAELRELLAYRDQILAEIAARSQQLSRYRSPALRTRAEQEIARLRQERGPSGNAGGGTPWPATSRTGSSRPPPWRRWPASSAASLASARWSRRSCSPICPNWVSSTAKQLPAWRGWRRSPRTAARTPAGARSKAAGRTSAPACTWRLWWRSAATRSCRRFMTASPRPASRASSRSPPACASSW